MSRLHTRPAISLSGWLGLALMLAAFSPENPLQAQASQKRVLVLYATRRDAQLVTVGDHQLPRIIRQGLSGTLDYYSEVIDRARYQNEDYEEAFRDFLRLKYGGQRFDVVITMDDASLEFLASQGTDLFPETPIVFFSSRESPLRPPNSTGVTAEMNLAGTLTLALTLQPETRNVFIVNGAARAYEELAHEQFRPFEPRVSITYLSGLPTNELETRLRTLPPRSIVYYLIVERDGAGENFHPLDYLERIAAVANAPTYSWVESTMGLGIVGGSLRSQAAQAEAVGALAVRVLRGQRTDDIPLSPRDLNASQVDWRELRRWGISESRVPAGTVVKFREPSLWDEYKQYILAGFAIVLGQAVLVGALLVQRSRRRQAEDRVLGREAELRVSYERIRDLGTRLLNSQEDERSRIARELHDDVSQQVALLAFDLELLNNSVDGDAGALVHGAVGRAQGIARSVHDLSHRLHPAKLRLMGLVAALNSLQNEVSRPGTTITFDHTDVPGTLPFDLTLSLFRVVQEAIQNALKYSRAREVSVRLKGTRDHVALTIVDDGVGFDVEKAWGKGIGLISMRERLESIGGRLDVRSKPGAGTRLEVTVPLRTVASGKNIAV